MYLDIHNVESLYSSQIFLGTWFCHGVIPASYCCDWSKAVSITLLSWDRAIKMIWGTLHRL